LRERIVAQFPKRENTSSILDWFRLPAPGAAFRYALATSAGLLLAVAVYESPPGFFDGHQSASDLVGTMASASHRIQGAVLDSHTFSEPGLESNTQLRRLGNTLLLDVQIEAEEPLDIALDFSGAGVSLGSVTQERTPVETIAYADRVVRIRALGRGRIAIHLNRVADMELDREAKIELEYSSKGRLLKQGSLEPVW
jgi:hypothetical protein